jgi:hypothetical protein
MNIILNASNSGLTAGVIFGFVFLVLFGVMTVKMIIEAVKPTKPQERTKTILLIPVGLFFCCIGVYIILLEYNLLNNCVYVEGTTIEYCSSGKSGKGIEFEYYLNGKRYTNCNTYNPINAIKVPGGKFKVRVSEFDPEIGRIDFEQPLTNDSKTNE